MSSIKSKLLGIIAEKIPSANKINTTGDDSMWAFLYFLVSVAPEEMLTIEYTTNGNNSGVRTVNRFYESLKNKDDYIVFKQVNNKDLFFTVDEAATLVFLRWLDMIHDKTIDMTFKNFLDGTPDLNGLSGILKNLVTQRFTDITNLPPYVQRILEACVSPTGKADNIKILTGGNTKMRFKDAKNKHTRNTDPRRRGGGTPLQFDFYTTSGAYEANLKMKLSEIYGFLEPTTIDVRSDIFENELKNNRSNFVPNEITMSIDQEGEPQQLSELINKNDKVSTRWNIPAMLDPGHKMLKRFGLTQDLQTLLGISKTRTTMISSYVIEPITFNFKVLNPRGNGIIPWMTLRWRINKPTMGNPRSFVMEHAVYGGSNSTLKNVTPVTKREAGSNANVNNISTNAKKAAKHYGDFAQILQSIVSTRESQAKIVEKLKQTNRTGMKCKAMGSGDGVLVGIYGLMATVFQRNSKNKRNNTGRNNSVSNVLNKRAKIALFLDVPDFRNKIYFYNQGFTLNPDVPMKNAVGGTNLARPTPGFSNRSKNQGPARTFASGNSNLGAVAAAARAIKNNNSILLNNIVKLLNKQNNNNRTSVNVSNKAREVYNKISTYRKGGAISKIYKSYSNLPTKTAKLNYARRLINVTNKNQFMNWEHNLNMASKKSTPVTSNASGIQGTELVSNNTQNSGNSANSRNSARSVNLQEKQYFRYLLAGNGTPLKLRLRSNVNTIPDNVRQRAQNFYNKISTNRNLNHRKYNKVNLSTLNLVVNTLYSNKNQYRNLFSPTTPVPSRNTSPAISSASSTGNSNNSVSSAPIRRVGIKRSRNNSPSTNPLNNSNLTNQFIRKLCNGRVACPLLDSNVKNRAKLVTARIKKALRTTYRSRINGNPPSQVMKNILGNINNARIRSILISAYTRGTINNDNLNYIVRRANYSSKRRRTF